MSRLRVDVYNDAGPTDPDAKQRQTYIGTEALRREHNKRDLAQARWELKTLGKSGVSERSKEVLKNAGLWKDASDMSRLRVDVYTGFPSRPPGRGHGWRDANRVVDARVPFPNETPELRRQIAELRRRLQDREHYIATLAGQRGTEAAVVKVRQEIHELEDQIRANGLRILLLDSEQFTPCCNSLCAGTTPRQRAMSRDAEKRASVGGRQTYGQLHDADLSGYTTNQLEVHIREGKSVGSTTIAMFKAELEKRRREGNLYPEKRWGVAKTLSGKPWGEDADSDIAYRGYMIRFNILGKIWVERDGQLISWASNVAGAKKIIDGLVATDNGEVTGPSNVRWSGFIVTVNGVETNCGNSLKKAWKIKQEAEAAGKQANITKRAR